MGWRVPLVLIAVERRRRWVTENAEEAIDWCETPPEPSMRGLLDQIAAYVPPPCESSRLSEPFALAVNNVGRYGGRCIVSVSVRGRPETFGQSKKGCGVPACEL